MNDAVGTSVTNDDRVARAVKMVALAVTETEGQLLTDADAQEDAITDAVAAKDSSALNDRTLGEGTGVAHVVTESDGDAVDDPDPETLAVEVSVE